MIINKISVLTLLALVLIGCSKPVPPEKSAYVGEWQEKTMYLLITHDGSVSYKRLKGGVATTVDGPLKGFTGDNFEVGIGPLSTTFVVNKIPYQEGDAWKMVVDNAELTRTSQ